MTSTRRARMLPALVILPLAIGTDFLELMTAMFNPLLTIALLPLALIWFGLGSGSLMLVHSVLWAVALNTHSGFRGMSSTLQMAGRNYGLSGIPFAARVLVPAAFPSILAGLKIG